MNEDCFAGLDICDEVQNLKGGSEHFSDAGSLQYVVSVRHPNNVGFMDFGVLCIPATREQRNINFLCQFGFFLSGQLFRIQHEPSTAFEAKHIRLTRLARITSLPLDAFSSIHTSIHDFDEHLVCCECWNRTTAYL